FEINKDLIRKYFLQEKYLRKRYRFFKEYTDTEQNNIRTTWYEYMTKIKAYVMFFDYLKIHINQQENKKYFEQEENLEKITKLKREYLLEDIKNEQSQKNNIKKIFMNKKTTTTWLTSDNKTIETIHPPSIQNNQIQATPFKLQTETSTTQLTRNETNKIIEQNNYTNKYLQTLGSQLSRIENTIQKINQNETKVQKIK
ncbi:hypothetical protein CFOL_v3_34608, partial [Cephalotus follicularis]